MNNLTLGTDDFTYYETLGGGQGACADAPTARAACTWRCPTRATRRSRRSSSSSRCASASTRSGAARAARAPAAAATASCASSRRSSRWRYSLLTERRRHAPPGAAGGEPGARGRNLLDGEELPPKARGSLARRSDPADRDARRWRTWQVSLSASSDWGSWARGWPRTSRAPATTCASGTARGRRAEAWAAEHGGTVAGSPREAAEGADGGDHDGRRRPAGRAGAARRGRRGARRRAAGTLFVDMSTIAPRRHAPDRRRARRARACASSTRPVTGSSPKAEDGTLTIMAGGAEADFARARPYFEAMGEVILHVGELGHGQKVKVISNAVAATNCATLAQALVVGKATGVDLEALLQVFGAGAANSTMVGLKGQPMLQHDYTTLFRLEHMLKDVAHLPRREPGRRRAVPGRRPRPRALRRRHGPRARRRRTSRRCSRWSRGSPASGSDAVSAAAACMPAFIRDLQGHYGIARSLCIVCDDPRGPQSATGRRTQVCGPGIAGTKHPLSPTESAMPIAFKEWAVTVRALAEGEQLVTLRKGGHPRARQALRPRPPPLLPLPDVRPPAPGPRARVAPARAAPRARGGRLGRRRAAGPCADRGRRHLASPTACGSAPGPRWPAPGR